MFHELLFVVLLENVYISAQQSEEDLPDSLVVAGDPTIEDETSGVDNMVTTSGNIAFGGQGHAEGSVMILASTHSGGPSSLFQPFGGIYNPIHYPFCPQTYWLGPHMSPLCLGTHPTPPMFLSTFSYPIYKPYLLTQFHTQGNYDYSKIMHIKMTLSTITTLPKVLISGLTTDHEIVCPIVKPAEVTVISPKMIVTSPIALRLSQYEFISKAISPLSFSYQPLGSNIGNVGSSQTNMLSVKPSLQLFPTNDPSDAIPINIIYPNKLPVTEDDSLYENDAVNSVVQENPPNLYFGGTVPVAGSFRITAKF